jgi:hypothetical protein
MMLDMGPAGPLLQETTMTRKDFVMIAAALQRARKAALDAGNLGQAEGVLLAASDEFIEVNDRFNRAKFISAVRGEA